MTTSIKTTLRNSLCKKKDTRGIIIITLHGSVDPNDKPFVNDTSLKFVKGNAISYGVVNYIDDSCIKRTIRHLRSKRIVTKLHNDKKSLSDVAAFVMEKIKERDTFYNDIVRLRNKIVNEYEVKMDDELNEYISTADRGYSTISRETDNIYINKYFTLLAGEKKEDDFDKGIYDNSIILIRQDGTIQDLLDDCLPYWKVYREDREFTLNVLLNYLDSRFEESVIIDLSCMETFGTLREKRRDRRENRCCKY